MAAAKLVAPLAGDLWSRAFLLIQRDTLNEVTVVTPLKGRPKPVAGLPGASGHDRLVHQVVAEDRRAVSAPLGHRLPEPSLDIPPFPFAEAIIPFGNALFVVTTQSGHVEVQADLLNQPYKSFKLLECLLIWLTGPFHELAKLRVDADHVGPSRFISRKSFSTLGHSVSQ